MSEFDIIIYKIRSLVNAPRYWHKDIKHAYQRVRYGYSDRDCWNGDNHLARQIAGILRWQVRYGRSLPIGYLPEIQDYSDLEFELAVEARNVEYLHYADIFEEYAKNSIALDDEWQRELGGVLYSDMKDALLWLSEHFSELWD